MLRKRRPTGAARILQRIVDDEAVQPVGDRDEVFLGDDTPSLPGSVEGLGVLTVPQVVSYNFARARHQARWTQVETSERLEPFLGYRLGQAGVSSIERTFHTNRRRKMSCAHVAAFARCFNRPLGGIFLPPEGHAGDIVVQPNTHAARAGITVAELVTLAVGTDTGWASLIARLLDLLVTDRGTVETALLAAFNGAGDRADWDEQLDQRRAAISDRVLARLTRPDNDEYLTDIAALLVQLAHLSPRARSSLLRAAS